MPLQATSGAASYDSFGGGVPVPPTNYIEDVFSTYLYTGTGSTQTITNGIDLSTKGGLVWIKGRSAATDHRLTDTARGATKSLASNLGDAQITESTGLTAFGTTGFTIGADADYNTNAATYVSWTFREQEKFFDIVTYTGNGVNRTIAHNLGSVPGCIIVKCTSTGTFWSVYHRSTGGTQVGLLDQTSSFSASSAYWNNTDPTSSVFTVGITGNVNDSGQTYVAYIFAHDAGGFGLTGTDNVISCGSYTGNGSATGPTVSLGYEPQWLLVKQSSTSGNDWNLIDNMRGFTVGGTDAELNPNLSNAESTGTFVTPNATGFQLNTTDAGYNANAATYIYIAIRRGPMKVPTSGTSVFTPSTASAGTNISVGFPSDLWIGNNADGDGSGNNHVFSTRLQGQKWLRSPTTAAESAASGTILWDLQNSFRNDQFGGSRAEFLLARAPNFMDVVCYTADGSATSQTLTHNLSVVPELMIVKARSGTSNWWTYSATLGATKFLKIDTTAASTTSPDAWNDTSPTSSNFTVGFNLNGTAGVTWVAYLFATCAGVSKVGSYTGTGTTKQIDCGFTGGARLILIKRTDASGDWYIYNSASGISSGNDPYMLMNTTAAQVTGTDYIDTYSAGFEISSTAPSAINASGGTFIFLAIA